MVKKLCDFFLHDYMVLRPQYMTIFYIYQIICQKDEILQNSSLKSGAFTPPDCLLITTTVGILNGEWGILNRGRGVKKIGERGGITKKLPNFVALFILAEKIKYESNQKNHRPR